jgi:3-oxoacyl-[acyl-carrier protein] reductase
MDMGIGGRAAVVCASTGGLGEACARALAAEGARVVVTGRRADKAIGIASELPGAVGIAVDFTEPGGSVRLFDAATEALGTIDIVVLNGPGPAPGGAAGLSRESVTTAITQLLLPHQELVALSLPKMRANGWGRIVAVGSSGIHEPVDNLALSNIGRAALGGYLKTLAREVAPDGVTVNIVSPGRIATDRVRQLDEAQAARSGRDTEEVAAESKARIPARRYGTREEYGAVVAFLCSAQASYVTGMNVRCDGGMASSL